MRKTLLTFLGLWLALSASAQINTSTYSEQRVKFQMDSLDYKIHQSSRVTFESQTMSRVLYSGRDYGLKGFGTSAQLSYYDKSGFWLSTVAYHWQGSQTALPKMDLTVGYATNLDEYLSASVSYSRWMYFGKSRDELKWSFDNFFSTYWTINLGFMGVSPSFYYMTSPAENVAQFAVTASKYLELRHSFLGGKLILEPNLTWMTSTFDRHNPSEPFRSAGKVLRVIDYEFALPIIYRRVGKFDLSPKLLVTLPVNILPSDNATEKVTTFFTLDFKYLIWRKDTPKK